MPVRSPGKAMPTMLLRRLDQVAVVHRGRRAHRAQDLAIFTDDEVEELCALAHKADTAKRLGQPVAWTAEEQIVLCRLEPKRAMTQ